MRRYNIKGLAEELEIDLNSISGLYTIYFEEMKEEIKSMLLYLKKSDWEMLERTVHNIKGVSANLSIMDVFSEAEKFDILLKKNEILNSREHITNLDNLISNAEIEIKEFFEDKGLVI
jgi:HPt (histidine-containing phosphotransfer) domain-containing protein